MGTHPNAPSMISGQADVSLNDWLSKHPEQLGVSVNKRFNGALPFLFKVLSVKKALSIQAHPNKVRTYFHMLVSISVYVCTIWE